MIVNRSVTRRKICRNGELIFILLCTLVIALKSVDSVSAKNSLPIEKLNNCGGEFFGYQYTIRSPNYPENYPENQDCVYTLRGSRLAKCEQVFHLQFLDFALPPSENCQEDYLEIGDRSLFCGSAVGIRRYPGKNNSLTLRFHSAAGRGGKGFKILVTTSPCDVHIGKDNDTNVTKRSPTTVTDQGITNNVITKKIGNPNDSQKLELLEAESSYPVYQPEIDFTVEDNRQRGRGDQNPFKIESIDKNEKNIVPSDQESFSIGSLNSFELPVHQNKLFRDTSTTKVAIVTPTPVKYQETVSPKISAYLFVPPSSDEDPKETDSLVRYSQNVPKVYPKNDVDNFINPPPTEFILPTKWTTQFRDDESTNNTGQLQLIQSRQRINQKFIVPARSYGIPDVGYYLPAKLSETSIKQGEVLDNPSGNVDCQGKDNFQADIEVTESFRNNNPAQIDTTGSGLRANYYPATTYGAPGLSYPTIVPKVNVAFTPSPTYGPPAGNYPGDSIAGRPNDWIPSPNFVPSSGIPTNNIDNRYPIFPNPGVGSGSLFPGNSRYSQCCRSEYSAQRFLLASPGFPSLFYSGNSYECVYAIRPFSSNICQTRFNFHYFNHGSEDSFCTNGYVDIDGRRFCGCKRGLSIVSRVSTIYPKTIGVRYSGYPRTKFNGFLIEVIQEPCGNSYPYLSRSKKDVGNTTHEIVESNLERISGFTNTSSQRAKRNLGYSYPKPNFIFNEEPGVSLSWTPGNSGNGGIHQVLNQGGIGGNIFAPISSCQALSFFDWINAAKDVYLRGARCIRNGGSGNGVPVYPGGSWVPGQAPGYPGGGSGTIIPGYPGNGGTINPGYPGNGGTINPGYPGNGGTINPGYPGNGGTINPGYPGNGGTINPGYPGNGGTINPGYPGNGGTINPGYPGNGGTINPGYPGNGGTINPGYPGNGGTINPGYPGNGGTINPGYPGNGGSGTIIPGYPGNGGTINPGYPGNGGWNIPSSKCEDVNVIEGIISSPQYPANYPNNVNKCYRFYKAPASCQLEVAFLDFDLENSSGCSKDYVAFSGLNRRYCGRSLAGSTSLIDMSKTNIVDIHFVSDGYGTGRGFSIGFSQISCRGQNTR